MNLQSGPGGGHPDDSTLHDAEMASLVRQYAERHEAPGRLVDHFYRLAEMERRENRWLARRFWQASFAGALAASLTLAVGFAGLDWLRSSKDSYDLVTQEAKSLRRQGDILPASIQGRQKKRLDQLFSSFNKDFRYRQKVSLPGQNEFVLEGATLREVEGKKVARLAYRTGDTRLILTVVPVEQNTEWPDFLREEGWVIMNGDAPRTFVWRQGPFIYALVGNLSFDRFKEFSAVIGDKTMAGK